MKKKITSLWVICVLISAVSSTISLDAQNLTKTNFISVLIPQFMGMGSTRLPIVFRARVQSLTPNTTYRYYNQAAIYTDLGSTNPGAGNPMLIDGDSSIYKYTTSPNLTTSANYESFRTDASGSYTGWFAFVYTSNARFTAGNYVIPAIVIGNTSGTVLFRYALNDSIKVIAFSNSSGANNGTGIYGITNSSAKNLIALYNNTSGTGSPLAVTYIENIASTVASSVQYYVDSVAGRNGRFGAIMPNNNPNGVRRVEELSLSTGSSVNIITDPDGNWPNANTVNPTGGLNSPLRLDITSVLPVEISFFNFDVVKNSVKLTWQTAWELNNAGFEVERSENSGNWIKTGSVMGNGNTNGLSDYCFTDQNLKTGKYNYRLKQIDFNGNFEFHALADIVIIGKPKSSEVFQNYPNPFNPVTNISFALAEDSFVKLVVYDITGREVKKLIESNVAAGYNSVSFDASDIASGVYFYRLESNGSSGERLTKIMKMLVVK
jgi:hypothetical protein